MGICRAILIRRRAAELCTVQGQGQDRLIGGFGRALDVLPGLAAVPADLPVTSTVRVMYSLLSTTRLTSSSGLVNSGRSPVVMLPSDLG